MQDDQSSENPPPPKRPKIRLACRECRDRKIRCDGGRPTCGACTRKRLGADSCVYAEVSDNPPEYVKTLENRIKDLEQAITRSHSSLALAPTPSREPGTPSLEIRTQPSSNHHQPPLLPRTTSETRAPHISSLPNVPRRDIQDAPATRIPLDGGRPDGPLLASRSLQQPPPDMDEDGAEREIMTMGTEGLTAANAATFGDPSSSIYLGRSSAAAFLQEIRDNPRKRRQSRNESGLGDSDERFLDSPSSKQSWGTSKQAENALLALMQELVLPPRRVANAHLENYWDNFYPYNPILHRPTFQKRYEEIWSQNVPTIASPLPQTAENQDVDSIRAFYALFNIILALGCLWSSNHGTSDSAQRAQADVFYHRSEALVSTAALNHGNLLSVQVYILTAQYLQITGKANRCWLTVGTAIRIAQGIGIHLNPGVESQAQQQERRRTWWYCIQMDRILSMTFGRPPMVIWPSSIPLPELTEDDLLSTQPYSSSEPIQQVEISTQGFVFVAVLSSAISLMPTSAFYMQPHTSRAETASSPFQESNYAQLLDLDKSLNEWRNQLPGYIRLTPEDDILGPGSHIRQALALHCRYLHLKMLMFRPSTVEAARGGRFNLSDNGLTDLQRSMAVGCVHSCIGAAEDIIRVLHARCTNMHGKLPNWWYTVFYVFTASTVILTVILSPHAESLCPGSSESIGTSWQRALEILGVYEAQGVTFARRISSILHAGLAQGQRESSSQSSTADPERTAQAGQQHDSEDQARRDGQSRHGVPDSLGLDGGFADLLMGESWWHTAGIEWLDNL